MTLQLLKHRRGGTDVPRNEQREEHPRPIEEWLEEKTGKAAAEVTIADVQALPRRRRHLRYAPLTSRLGGRLDRHLEHLDDDEVERLLERGDRFLDETPSTTER